MPRLRCLVAVIALLGVGGCGHQAARPASADPGSRTSTESASPSPSSSSPSATPTAPPDGLLAVADAAAILPALAGADRTSSRGPVAVVGRRCGLVPNASGGQGEPLDPPGRSVQMYAASSSVTLTESVTDLRDPTAADAVLQRYRDYLGRCAGRNYGGDWEGTVTSVAWQPSGLGDASVGMLDRVEDRGGPSVQRTAVVRSGTRVVIVRVTAPDAVAPGDLVRLAGAALG